MADENQKEYEEKEILIRVFLNKLKESGDLERVLEILKKMNED